MYRIDIEYYIKGNGKYWASLYSYEDDIAVRILSESILFDMNSFCTYTKDRKNMDKVIKDVNKKLDQARLNIIELEKEKSVKTKEESYQITSDGEISKIK